MQAPTFQTGQISGDFCGFCSVHRDNYFFAFALLLLPSARLFMFPFFLSSLPVNLFEMAETHFGFYFCTGAMHGWIYGFFYLQ